MLQVVAELHVRRSGSQLRLEIESTLLLLLRMGLSMSVRMITNYTYIGLLAAVIPNVCRTGPRPLCKASHSLPQPSVMALSSSVQVVAFCMPLTRKVAAN